MIPFSPPRIDQRIIDEVTAALQSGWITTGPRVKQFEKNLSAFNGNAFTLALNSATAGLEIILRWYGVGPGDEVILPAYTYSATANVVEHCGAKPVFADVHLHDFNINVQCIAQLINERTKVVMPVDFAGFPCDYDEIMALVQSEQVRKQFRPAHPQQEKLGRIMVLSDAAHSIGARYKGKRTGTLADASVFSFHAVKNLTTAEGGAIALHLPEPFSNEAVYQELCIKILHGQNKDALAKMQKGNWRYDIVEPGYKFNMTDLQAAIGLVELERYDSDTLVKRKAIVNRYHQALKGYAWAELPITETDTKTSSFHLYPLRIHHIDEATRDRIIQHLAQADVAVNVHFIPVPMMSYYRSKGYDIKHYPVSFYNYMREISLPVFYDLTQAQQQMVIDTLVQAVEAVLPASP